MLRYFHNCKEKTDGTVTTTEQISSISKYKFEGTFEEIIDNIKKERENYEVPCYKDRYVRIYIIYETPEYEDEKEFCVIGERVLDEVEMGKYREWKIYEQKSKMERDQKEFLRLKQIFSS